MKARMLILVLWVLVIVALLLALMPLVQVEALAPDHHTPTASSTRPPTRTPWLTRTPSATPSRTPGPFPTDRPTSTPTLAVTNGWQTSTPPPEPIPVSYCFAQEYHGPPIYCIFLPLFPQVGPFPPQYGPIFSR